MSLAQTPAAPGRPRELDLGPLAGIGPTLAIIFVLSFLAGGLVSSLFAAPPGDARNMAEHDRVMLEEVQLAQWGGGDPHDPDGGAGTTGREKYDMEEGLADEALMGGGLAAPSAAPGGARKSPRKAPKFQNRLNRLRERHGIGKSKGTLQLSPGIMPVRNGQLVYGTVHGKPVRGYLATPETPLPGDPAVVVIHEWWGLNSWVKHQADELARVGYRALAVDLYGGRVAGGKDPDRARKKAMALMKRARKDLEGTIDNLGDALRYLRRRSSRVGVLGWCMGGGFSLDAAIRHADLVDACVVYYGHVHTEAEMLTPLKAPVLGNFAGKDKGIPVDTVKAFEDALRVAGKQYDIKIYKNAKHAFANPNRTDRHRRKDARHAWKRTLSFFRRHLVEKKD